MLTVDGVDVVNAADSASVATLNEGLFPSKAGASHTFSILDVGASAPRTITMVSANVTSTPVQNVGTISTAAGKVGYMLFNDHVATAEQALVNAFRQLAAANVTDLVLDIRYNGGGYLDIASEVAYMVAGSGHTAGRTFEKTVFSDKHPTRDPVTGQTDRAGSVLYDLPGILRTERPDSADAQPLAGDRADGSEYLLGQRVHHQRPQRRGRSGPADRIDDLRKALRLLSSGQLRHDVLLDRIQGRQRQGVRGLSGRVLPGQRHGSGRRSDARLCGGRRF